MSDMSVNEGDRVTWRESGQTVTGVVRHIFSDGVWVRRADGSITNTLIALEAIIDVEQDRRHIGEAGSIPAAASN